MIHDEILNYDFTKLFTRLTNLVQEGVLSLKESAQFAIPAFIFKKLLHKKEKIACFYFDQNDFDEDDVLHATARDFLKEKVMDYPFDKCIYVLKNFVLLEKDNKEGGVTDGAALFVKLTPELKNEIAEITNTLNYPIQSNVLAESDLLILDFIYLGKEIYLNPFIVFVNTFATENSVCLITLNEETDVMLQKGSAVAGALESATMLLNTKYAVKTENSIPEKINSKRKKIGKEPHYYTSRTQNPFQMFDWVLG